MATQNEMVQILGITPELANKLLNRLKSSNINVLKEKQDYYINTLGIEKEDFSRMLSQSSTLLTHDTKVTMPAKIEALKEILDTDDDEKVKQIIIKFPPILGYDLITDDKNSVRSKMKFYKKTFNISNDKLMSWIKRSPCILGYDCFGSSPTSVLSKVAFYQKLFGTTFEKTTEIISNVPLLLDFDCNSNGKTSLKNKVSVINSLGLDNKYIASHAQILVAPADNIKFRYMLFSTVLEPDKFKNSKWYGANEQKVYARIEYLKAINATINVSVLTDGNPSIPTERILQKYPLDEKAVHKIEDEYVEMTKQKRESIRNIMSHFSGKKISDNNMPLELTREEIKAVAKIV